jgi:dTDP-4-dehydrorhamnose 3,5-epimerase
MNVVKTAIPGVTIFEPKVFGDERGFFMEAYNKERYHEAGLKEVFVQDNLSKSQKSVLRGLHIQNPFGQGKLVSVILGAVLDVAVDVRKGSPHFGEHVAVELSENNRRQFYVPPGFAHGFLVLSESALFSYKCTELYRPENEFCIKWDDPQIGINWPTNTPIVSDKDQAGKTLAHLDSSLLPDYESD